MGEAKRRGTYEQRVEEAHRRASGIRAEQARKNQAMRELQKRIELVHRPHRRTSRTMLMASVAMAGIGAIVAKGD